MTAPQFALTVAVHPLALERDDADCVVTVRVDVTALDDRLVTAGARLAIDPAPGIRVKGVISTESRGQPIPLDGGRAVAVRDLAPGGRQSFLVELLLTPSAVGTRRLARFGVTCESSDGPSATAEAVVDVTDDPARAGAPNPDVMKLAGTHRAIRFSDKAEADIAGGKIPDAVAKLGRATRELRQLGELATAAEVEKKAQELAAASPDQRDLMIKRLRATTKQLIAGGSAPDPAGRGGSLACPHCGNTKLVRNEASCGACDSDLTTHWERVAAAPAATGRHEAAKAAGAAAGSACPQCDMLSSAGARFCEACGTQLRSHCPGCRRASRPGANFCAWCGVRFAAGADAVPGSVHKSDFTAAIDQPSHRFHRAYESDIAGEFMSAPAAAMVRPTPPGWLPRIRRDPHDLRFSCFYPEVLAPEGTDQLIVYAHPQVLTRKVARKAAERFGPGVTILARTTAPARTIPAGSTLLLTPEVPGLVFDSPTANLALWDDIQSTTFRFRPETGRVGRVCRGWVNVWFQAVLVAALPVTVFVTDDPSPRPVAAGPAGGSLVRRRPDPPGELALPAELRQASARPYRAVFPSYSHKDSAVVERLEAYAVAFGDEYLRDVRTLRAGQSWKPEVVRLIDRADVFQLFWSESAGASPYVEQEWRHALRVRRARPDLHFVRPVYWADRHPPIPPDLREIHFARLPLGGDGPAPAGPHEATP